MVRTFKSSSMHRLYSSSIWLIKATCLRRPQSPSKTASSSGHLSMARQITTRSAISPFAQPTLHTIKLNKNASHARKICSRPISSRNHACLVKGALYLVRVTSTHTISIKPNVSPLQMALQTMEANHHQFSLKAPSSLWLKRNLIRLPSGLCWPWCLVRWRWSWALSFTSIGGTIWNKRRR